MENIFKNAKFGDKFKTRNGTLALFIAPSDDYEFYNTYELEVEHQGRIEYIEDGRYVYKCGKYGHEDLDIVSKCNNNYDKLRKLSYNMYSNMKDLSNDLRPLRKSMEDFHRFICFEEKN